MKESEGNQDIAQGLDMEKGLHQNPLYLNYPQKFMHAPHSAYPQKNLKGGMKCEPGKAMSETLYAK